jgi:hypothetical protein
VSGHLRTRPRIEPIAPGVADKVERKYGSYHGQCWKYHHVRGVEEMAARIIEHGAPTGNRSEHAESEKTQRASRVDRAVALRYE